MFRLDKFIVDELRRTGPSDSAEVETQIKRLLDRALKNRWRVAFRDRGMGHGDFGVTVRLGKSDVLIVGDLPYKEIAEHICRAHNAGRRSGKEN